MISYHAVLLDETRCEFGHSFKAKSRTEAWEYLREQFPESQCVQLEDPEDTRRREHETYKRACREYSDNMAPSFWDEDEDE
jgi:hypothetical protein